MGEDRAQNDFNMAVSYLNRLNVLFYTANDAAMTLDAAAWFHTLMALERELSTEMRPDEIKAFALTRSKINNDLALNTARNTRTGRQEIPPTLYESLHSYELDIRRIVRESGLQTKIIDDAMKALK
jgi:hypothetical protein